MNAETIQSFWEEGIVLWYAEDYLNAMEVWHDGLNELNVPPINFPEENEYHLTPSHGCRTGINAADSAWLTNCGRNNSTRDSISWIAPLFLFLAGCYLDAQQYERAEQCCRKGLQLALCDDPSTIKMTLVRRFAQELLSCWEEDPDVMEHWKRSYALYQWIIIKQQQQQQQQHCDPESRLSQSPWQRPAFVVPRPLPSQAVCPRDEHPAWCRILEQHAATIRQELMDLLPGLGSGPNDVSCRVGDGHHRQGAGAHDGSVVSAGGEWREIVLFGAGAVSSLSSSTVAPQTRALVSEHCPDAVSLANQGGGEVIFSILAPQTRIAPHCASTNLRWTAHLGLVLPASSLSSSSSAAQSCARIRIADQWHTWQQGRMLVFDDSFEHEVVNESENEIRVVLLMRFWNPHLPVSERSSALQQALAWKALEQERRFHPPRPSPPCWDPQFLD